MATQVVQRDLHAEFIGVLALIGASIERWATEFRHLQRTEVLEAEEFFAPGQKGSSAMPHKRNPITGERLTGPGARAARQRGGRPGKRRPLARTRHQPQFGRTHYFSRFLHAAGLHAGHADAN